MIKCGCLRHRFLDWFPLRKMRGLMRRHWYNQGFKDGYRAGYEVAYGNAIRGLERVLTDELS